MSTGNGNGAVSREALLEQHARAYAAHRFAIVWTAANEGENAKRVLTKDWQTATPLPDPDFAAGLFRERGKGRNPAISLRGSGLVGIECDGANDLAEVEALRLPTTITATSSAPDRRHFFFRPPAGRETLPKVSFRFEGGAITAVANNYYVAPPSLHPSGVVYSFLPDHSPWELDPAELPAKVYDALLAAAERSNGEQRERLTLDPSAKVSIGGRRDAIFRLARQKARWEADRKAVADESYDWNLRHCDPPLTREQVEEQVEGAFSARYPIGEDLDGALDRPPAKDDPAPPADVKEGRGHTWAPLDIIELGKNPPAPPDIWGLFYPEQRHVVSGEHETGKSMAALAATADEIAHDRGVVWVDTDSMGPRAILERLRQLGLSDGAIRRYFVYLRPSEALDGDSLTQVLELMSERSSRLIIFDSFNATLMLHNLDPNSTVDVERFWRLTDAFTGIGAAVVCLDHVVKNAEARGRYSYGSERKQSGADVHLGLTTLEQIARGKTGRSRVIVHKDRVGYHRDNPPGVFQVTSDPETGMIATEIVPDESKGEDGSFRPTVLMERVSKYLELFPGEALSRNKIEKHVDGTAEWIRKAIDRLISEGCAEEVPGPHNARSVRLIRFYREADEGQV